MHSFFFILICLIYATVAFGESKPIEIKLPEGTFIVDPQGLKLSFKANHKMKSNILTLENKAFSIPEAVNVDDETCKILYDHCRVEIFSSEGHVHFKVYPKNNTLIKWPLIVEDSDLQNYLLPEGEGLLVPVKDQKIRMILDKKSVNHMHMLPFVGLMYKNFMLTIIENTPYRNTLKINPVGEGIQFVYDFRMRDRQPCYELIFNFTKPNLLAPAKIFRAFLLDSDQFVTLEEKIKFNVEVNKLAGAIHIYVWGDGRTDTALKKLSELGVTKAWIGYEEKPNFMSTDKWSQTEYVNADFIKFGNQLGYLIGAYDSYHTAQPSETADAYNTDFGKGAYPRICIRNKNNDIVAGFGGRGCTVSMTALDNDNNIILKKRISKFKLDGVNSYFLDCHGMLEAYDDYSIDHPQTILEDILIRLKHLNWLSRQKLVLGTEAATTYTIPFVSFSHGNFSTLFQLHYNLSLKNKEIYGGWGPAKRPAIFFKSLKADKDYVLRYAPQYRIPLFQAVFHDSIVTTDRWEIPLVKFTNLYKQRFLLEFLYGVPSIWSLDLKAIKQYKAILNQLANEFTDFHTKIMTKELKEFEYLTLDHTVQKTVFGNNEVSVIANFREDVYEDIPGQSLKIIFHDSGVDEIKIIKPFDLSL